MTPQGPMLHQRVSIKRNNRVHIAVCIRQDRLPPNLTLYLLDDGTVITQGECEFKQAIAPDGRVLHRLQLTATGEDG